ncbi:plasmid mobilization relaxosome protein MobC [Chitinophaga sp. Cy-1792]|uniref:plasmid mobilization protein n=1 Tax=Chitinophaga sp. Cy-1792 TaxID=2608339 RepID=UPI00141DDDA1|nr:plasmid mobilization relaxosome protein MobC [Chitinophaga sp. Cy-1792]
MARPRKNESEKRVVQVNIRLTSCENQRVNELAKSVGITPANLIRQKLFAGRFPPVKHSPIEIDLYRELHRIGVNLNQATHRINRNELPGEYLSILIQVSKTVNQAIKLLVNDRRSG